MAPVEHLAGAQHGRSQGRDVGASHAFEKNSHEPGRDLIIREISSRVSANHKLDFGSGKLVPIPFSANQIDQAHGLRITLFSVTPKRSEGSIPCRVSRSSTTPNGNK